MSNNNSATPSPSPQKPRAGFLGIVQQLDRLTQVGKDELLNAAEIAEEVFTFLSDISDQDLENGSIKTDDEALKPYAAALNRLFPLVRNSETGSVNQLNSKTVEKLSQKAYAITAAIGGRPFVELMCNIVNEEVQGRIPSVRVSRVQASQAFQFANHDLHNSIPA